MNKNLRDYGKKGVTYVLLPLTALTGAYIGGRIHQHISDQGTAQDTATQAFYDRNKEAERGAILVAKEMADENPAIYGLARVINKAFEGRNSKVLSIGSMQKILEQK